jgi:hypothetical protein
MSLELPIFAQPKLGLRNRRSQWTREPFVDHPGSLNRRRVRNDVADCNDDDHRNSECNDHSLGVSHDLATHGQSPIHRVRHLWCPCRYNDRTLSNTPVTDFIGAQIFLPATLCNRVAQVVRSVLWNACYTPSNSAVSHNCRIQVVDSGCRAAIDTRSRIKRIEKQVPRPISPLRLANGSGRAIREVVT